MNIAPVTSRRSRRLPSLLAAALAIVPSWAAAQICATPGKDGRGGVLTGIVNTYYPGSGTAAAGGTSITIGAAVAGSTPITAGDLLLVIQMQDAAVNSANSTAYGANNGTGRGSTGLGNSGLYEYVVANSAVGLGGGTVTIIGASATNALINTYTTAASTAAVGQKRFQVIRVPQYSSATFSSGLTAYPWDGNVGGVLAVDVAGPLTLGGTVSVAGMGFRGGGGRQLQGTTPKGLPTDYMTVSTTPFHAGKGEGIGGTPRYLLALGALLNTGAEGYPGGSYARGAPGNAGGGGTDGDSLVNQDNSGGGGGAGAGAGGKGGFSWRSSLDVGGLGGIAFAAAFGRVSLGGGGGAGTTNNGTGTPGSGLASSGATGGGIVMVRADTVRATGTINASGADANQTTNNDGSGGGGGGGSILFYVARGGLGGLTAIANGGRGGNNAPTGPDHGPGGGGGGGYIAVSTAAGSATVAAGARGVTSGSNAFGAANGNAGVSSSALLVSSMPGVRPNAACMPRLTVTKRTLNASVVAGDSVRYEITVANAAGRNSATSLFVRDTLPNGASYLAGPTVVFNGGASRPTVSNPATGALIPAFSAFTIPGGGSIVLTFSVRVASNTPTSVLQNGAHAGFSLAPSDTNYANYLSASSTNDDVAVSAAIDLTVTKSHVGNIAVGRPVDFTITVPNGGAVPSSGPITVLDTLPTGLTFVSGTGTNWSCGAVAAVITCTSAQVVGAGGISSVLTIRAGVGTAAVPSLTNRARVSLAAEPVVNRTNNVATDASPVLAPGVQVTPDLSAIDRLPSNGTQYSQVFTVANLGVVRDTFALTALKLPGTTLTLISVNGVAGTAGSVALDSAGTASVTVVYTVGPSAAGTVDTLALRAVSKLDATKLDRGDWDVRVIRAAITMTKTAYRDNKTTLISASDRVVPGEFLQYRIAVTSAGVADASTVQVSDTLPASVIYDSSSGDAAGWTLTQSAGVVTGALSGTLPNGQIRFFWVRVRVR